MSTIHFAALHTFWLPILLSSVLVFIASSVIHMAPLWHKSDVHRMPMEPQVIDALRPLAIPPGDYFIPRASGMQEMKTPEFKDKMTRGPVAVITVMPNGPIPMTRNLVQWFVFLLVVGVFVTYISARGLPINTPYLRVFKSVAVTAFACYALALVELSIWYRRSWVMTAKTALDGVIYALLTAGVFGWLWPH